jgi:hypothetical protein
MISANIQGPRWGTGWQDSSAPFVERAETVGAPLTGFSFSAIE